MIGKNSDRKQSRFQFLDGHLDWFCFAVLKKLQTKMWKYQVFPSSNIYLNGSAKKHDEKKIKGQVNFGRTNIAVCMQNVS